MAETRYAEVPPPKTPEWMKKKPEEGLTPDQAAAVAALPEGDEMEAARWCRGNFSRRALLKVGDYPSRTHWEFMRYGESDPKWLFDPRWLKGTAGKPDEDETLEIDLAAVEEFEAAVAAGKARMA